MKFSYNYKNGKEEIICHTNMKEFDGISYGIMQNEYELFLPAEVQEEAEGYIFIYNMSGMVNFRAWMHEVSKSKQRKMREEIMEKIQKLLHMGILQEQLLTTERYMYVDERTEHIRFICVAATDKKRTEVPYESSGLAIPPVPPVPTEDAGTVIDPDFQEKFWNDGERDQNQRPEQKVNVQKSDVTEVLEDLDNAEETTISLNENLDEGEETTVLLEEEFRIDASLRRVSTEEIFQINKKVSVVGKSVVETDIVIRDNKTVSRKHCIISVEDGEYYLEDNNSKNGTYLEDVKVQPGEKVILQDGCKLRLSNEEFIFYINER